MHHSGFDRSRLARIEEVVAADIGRGRYFGTSIKVARGGELALDLALGHTDPEGRVPVRPDTVFSILSVTKAFINTLVLRAVDLGRVSLTARMTDYIPEYTGAPRDSATILHFLTHTTGVPAMWEMRPDQYFDDLDEILATVVQYAHGSNPPGERCDYSPMANHVLLAAVLCRIDPAGRRIGQILREDLFDPLGMTDTSLGLLPHMRERHAFPEMRGIVPVKALSRSHPGDNGLYAAEVNEAPWMGAASTTGDLFRLAEMLRRGGDLEGARILSPRMIELARRNHTGELPNELYKTVALRAGYAPPPAYIGLGFSVRGDRIVDHQFGTLTSPETFGNYGAGSSMFWVDPVQDITFVALSSGLLPQADNIRRFQQLSDMVVGAAI
jgi:CubicO group peptidase (beta-lactamase class C family)